MVKDTEKKQLHYRRAKTSGVPLETMVRDAHRQRFDVTARTFSLGEDLWIRCQTSTDTTGSQDDLLLLDIVKFRLGQSAAVVLNEEQGSEGATHACIPPEQTSFQLAQTFVLLAENHVIFCSVGCRENLMGAYLEWLAREAWSESYPYRFDIRPVARLDKLSLIHREGIKSINIKSTVTKAGHAHMEHGAHDKCGVRGGLGLLVNAMFPSTEERPEHWESLGKMNMNVSLSIPSREKKWVKAVVAEQLAGQARSLIEEGADDFVIVTGKDNKITPDELRVSKTVGLPKHANSVQTVAAWNALRTFFCELREDHRLEQ